MICIACQEPIADDEGVVVIASGEGTEIIHVDCPDDDDQ